MSVVNSFVPNVIPPLQMAYVELLQRYHWQFFCTLTFRYDPHPENAYKAFTLWVSRINDQIYGKHWKRRDAGIYWCLALEYTKKGVIHFHALLGDSQDLNHQILRSTAGKIWWEIGGMNKILPIDSDRMVLNYVAKYTSKGGQIDFSPNLAECALTDRPLALDYAR